MLTAAPAVETDDEVVSLEALEVFEVVFETAWTAETAVNARAIWENCMFMNMTMTMC